VSRRAAFVMGPVLIALGLAQVPLFDGHWRAQDLMPVDAHVDVFDDATNIQFTPVHSGYYGVQFVVAQSKPYDQVYCLLRSPADYWSPVVCDRGVSFMAKWTLSENGYVVQSRGMDRASAGISTFGQGSVRYMRRYLGMLYAEKGHYYMLKLVLTGADVGLAALNPRLQLTLDESTVETRSWLALWAYLAVPGFILWGAWLLWRGIARKE
jgi:hypothetical protein